MARRGAATAPRRLARGEPSVIKLDVMEIATGLWRWTAPHPAWKPGGVGPAAWDEMVGCVYYEPPGADVLVLVDPLVPMVATDDHARFLRALDRDVERLELPVAILISNESHGRSAQDLLDRYRTHPGATTWAHERAVAALSVPVTHPFGAATRLPGDVT